LDQRWFQWGMLAHVAVLLLLAHGYDMLVFQDVARRLLRGEGIYAPFGEWLARHGDEYYAYPPLFAYLLWISGRIAVALGGHWWLEHLFIKGWMLLADLLVFGLLYRAHPGAARTYWTWWIVPVAGIAHVQPDLWVGLAVLSAYALARRERWPAVGLLLAAGIGVKFIPLLIMPFLVGVLVQARRYRAALQLCGALAAGLLIVWLPYAVAYEDATQFARVIHYHLSRPPAGLTAATGLRFLIDVQWAVQVLTGIEPSRAAAMVLADDALATFYRVLTPLAFVLLGAVALGRRWSLEQAFLIPLLTFLLVNRVVNEQYLLMVLPLLLLVDAPAVARLARPYAVYLFAAGTPLRFLPREYGWPLSVEALVPEPLGGTVTPWIGVGLALASGGAALLFSYRLWRLLHRIAGEGAGERHQVSAVVPEGARG